jgi:hypothetical protein
MRRSKAALLVGCSRLVVARASTKRHAFRNADHRRAARAKHAVCGNSRRPNARNLSFDLRPSVGKAVYSLEFAAEAKGARREAKTEPSFWPLVHAVQRLFVGN